MNHLKVWLGSSLILGQVVFLAANPVCARRAYSYGDSSSTDAAAPASEVSVKQEAPIVVKKQVPVKRVAAPVKKRVASTGGDGAGEEFSIRSVFAEVPIVPSPAKPLLSKKAEAKSKVVKANEAK